MKKGIKALVIIIIIIIFMIAGFVVISKIELSDGNLNNIVEIINSNNDIKIHPNENSDDTTEAAGSSDIMNSTDESDEVSPTAAPAATPAYTAAAAPEITPVPTPQVPISNNDRPQIYVKSNMNGHIYVSYKSNKDVKVLIDKDGESLVYDLLADGRYQRFSLHLGDGDYSISIAENAVDKSYRLIKTKFFTCNMINDKFPYLFSNSYVRYKNDDEFISFGLELTKNAYTQEEKARAIYDWIVRNVEYDFSIVGKLEAGYQPDPQETFETKLGICADFAVLFASMCRSQGIVCKVVLGYYEKSEYYHAWNEVYFDNAFHIIDTSGDSQTKVFDFTREEGYIKNIEH